MKFWRRTDRLEESKRAIEKQERLGLVIDLQASEARVLGAWARDRLERNHLTQLFEGIVHEGRR